MKIDRTTASAVLYIEETVLNSSFPRQLTISAAVLVFTLLPLLHAGNYTDEDYIFSGNSGEQQQEIYDYPFSNRIAGLDLYSPDDYIKRIVLSGDADMSSVLYRDPQFSDQVLRYYEAVVGSCEIAETGLKYSSELGVPVSLAFALMWAESSFDPYAVNRNPITIDRGLFQLNSSSFPHLSVEDFFNIETNVRNGISYLRYCLDTGESEIVALAVYNAGHGRVSGAGAPLMTLEHISKILDYRDALERDFERYISMEGKIRTDKKSSRNLIPVVDTGKSLK